MRCRLHASRADNFILYFLFPFFPWPCPSPCALCQSGCLDVFFFFILWSVCATGAAVAAFATHKIQLQSVKWFVYAVIEYTNAVCVCVCVCGRRSDRHTIRNEMHFGTTVKTNVGMCLCVGTALHEQNECIFFLLLPLLFGERSHRLSFCPESLFACACLLRGSIVTAFNWVIRLHAVYHRWWPWSGMVEYLCADAECSKHGTSIFATRTERVT